MYTPTTIRDEKEASALQSIEGVAGLENLYVPYSAASLLCQLTKSLVRLRTLTRETVPANVSLSKTSSPAPVS